MKKLLILILSTAFFACNAPASEEAKTAETASEKSVEHAHHNAPPLKLNNGEKWEANVETTTGVNNMIGIVETGIADQTPPPALVPQLNKEMETIFAKCTMKGESHDQLHNFLVPLQGMIKKADNDQAGVEDLKTIHNHLAVYAQYFE